MPVFKIVYQQLQCRFFSATHWNDINWLNHITKKKDPLCYKFFRLLITHDDLYFILIYFFQQYNYNTILSSDRWAKNKNKNTVYIFWIQIITGWLTWVFLRSGVRVKDSNRRTSGLFLVLTVKSCLFIQEGLGPV